MTNIIHRDTISNLYSSFQEANSAGNSIISRMDYADQEPLTPVRAQIIMAHTRTVLEGVHVYLAAGTEALEALEKLLADTIAAEYNSTG